MDRSTTEVKILVPGHHQMVRLLGQRDELLKLIEQSFSTSILVRGNEIHIAGEKAEAERVGFLFEELITLLEAEQSLTLDGLERTIDMVKTSDVRPSEVLTDAALVHRGRVVRPKTPGQKDYVDAIRTNTISFGIGPAGTGKSYLAVAMAVRALLAKEVQRIILTRPAVEAGERLGYLPGTLMEKVDPYMRPLYDALMDLMDAEKMSQLIQRGVIEISPLAYMRGRAQPTSSPVLTPWGFQSIGSLQVGDWVIGSNGRPTLVLGVYPQGKKPVFRVQTQDGASTLCCGEHLWSVTTAADRRRGTSRRTVETREMVGKLRSAHAHRFELPLLSRPAQFPARDVPMDPYALGLLLGDGCITGKTTPSFSTEDPELIGALERAFPDIELRPRSGIDYVLRNRKGRKGFHPGGVIVENPVMSILRELGLDGTNSSTKFVPELYLLNSPDTRLAVLQGLLDADGGPVAQFGRTCRIQYGTNSPRLRDDVVFLVQSLGGVAYCRTRPAEGRAPGRARGREVHHRHDSYVIDIRLPRGLPPFRLHRKARCYAHYGGGRPMRFIDKIEPAGEEETVCIAVGAADSLYVTDDFLLTHNTLNGAFIILDEAQNTTPEQMKMFLTRLGFGSKVVVTGDVTQVDLPSGQHSGLNAAREILTDIEGVKFVFMSAKDVVRHKIVQEIVEAYRRFDESK